MKSFACGDVVPGCQARFVCSTEDELFGEIARHAQADHGLTDLDDDLVSAVRAGITDVE